MRHVNHWNCDNEIVKGEFFREIWRHESFLINVRDRFFGFVSALGKQFFHER